MNYHIISCSQQKGLGCHKDPPKVKDAILVEALNWDLPCLLWRYFFECNTISIVMRLTIRTSGCQSLWSGNGFKEKTFSNLTHMGHIVRFVLVVLKNYLKHVPIEIRRHCSPRCSCFFRILIALCIPTYMTNN